MFFRGLQSTLQNELCIFTSALVLMVPLFYHSTFTKKGGSTSTDTMMVGPDTGKSTIFMLFFIVPCAPADMRKIREAQQTEKRG